MPYVWSTIAVAAAVLIGYALRSLAPLPNVSLIFLLAVLFPAVRFGMWPAIYASFLSFLAYNFFFIHPIYTFSVAEPHELLALVIFLVVAIITSALAGRVRDQAREMVRARTAAETERVRNTLLAAISHDFRTPLSSILGAATSLLDYRDKLGASAQADLLGQIKQEAEGLDEMVRNLLAITRIDAGGLELNYDWVDLRGVCSGLSMRHAGAAPPSASRPRCRMICRWCAPMPCWPNRLSGTS
jgi:K+-sensing histidine kinase KdpD